MLWTISLLSSALAVPPPVCSDDIVNCTCQSMFALELAHRFELSSCDNDATIPCPDASGFCTANQFAKRVYEDPFDPALTPNGAPASPTGANLIARAAPMCEDGTDSCATGSRVRCVDGTRPVYWVNFADTASDEWVFTFQGGGSCGRSETEQGGEACWSFYTGVVSETNTKPKYSRDQMTGWMLDKDLLGEDALVGPLTDLVGTGIHSDSSVAFGDVNRVYVPKCGSDRNTGTRTLTDHATSCPTGWDCSRHASDPTTGGRPQTDGGDAFNLPFHGRLIVSSILADLASPASGEPDLSNAQTILFSGHSGGAQGLIHNLDSLADEASGIAPKADIRGLIDARGWPSLNHIIASERFSPAGTQFEATDTLNMSCADCLPEYDYVHSSGGLIRSDNSISAINFRVGERVNLQVAYQGTTLDSSCLSHVPWLQTWRCRDTSHVMWNHLETPFFLRQAVRDVKHTSERAPEFIHDAEWRWSNPEDYRQHVVRQVLDWQDWVDGTTTVGPLEPDVHSWMTGAPGLGLFLPDATRHQGLFEHEFLDQTMAQTDCATDPVTYEQAVRNWLDGTGDRVFVAPETASGAGDLTCP